MAYIQTSKYLSYILRHQPGKINLVLDAEGWADVNELIQKIQNTNKYEISHDILDKIVQSDNKGRYEYSENKTHIRACQGHTNKDVKITYSIVNPPQILYHGTTEEAHDLIRKSGGLSKMQRHHVHLTNDYDTAVNVGSRRGKPYVFTIYAQEMSKDGFKFYISNNGVYLVDSVPNKYM